MWNEQYNLKKPQIEKILPSLFPNETGLSVVCLLDCKGGKSSFNNPYDKRDCDFENSFLVLKHSKHGQHESAYLFAAFLYWTEGERGWLFESDFHFPHDPQESGSWTAKWMEDPEGEFFKHFLSVTVSEYPTFQRFKKRFSKYSKFDVSMMKQWNGDGWTVETE